MLAIITALAWLASSFQLSADSVQSSAVSSQQTTTATTTTDRPSFADFLAGVRKEALARGFREDIVDQALSNIDEPLPVVLERDRTQAETVLSLDQYIARRLTAKRIRTGREMLARHKALLADIAEKYGVPPRIIVGIWGSESDYGALTGIRPLVGALATLAWEGRRATFFRGELFHALEILQRGDIDYAHLKGSWAGAMGQPQFMPSSYVQYAEDFNGDGRKDIWSTEADIFASIANYLKGRGWTSGDTWGREVKVSPALAKKINSEVARRESNCRARREMTVALPMKEWQALGVLLPGGKPLPAADVSASLVSGAKRFFLVYPNYDALLEYNCANSYAVSVGLLGDAVASTAPITPTATRAPGRRPQRGAPARKSR